LIAEYKIINRQRSGLQLTLYRKVFKVGGAFIYHRMTAYSSTKIQ